MASSFPYVYISCPCSDASRRAINSKRVSRDIDYDEPLDQDDSTFNPRDPRSAFSLFPPEHLFYCEDCQDMKCPRCVIEEIICWYCPQCLFESVPSSVKPDGNRCSRNCFVCPICQSQLNTSSLTTVKPSDRPYVLNCQYCMWTSLDAGISFPNPSGIRQQVEGKDKEGRDAARSSVSTARLSTYGDLTRARGSSALAKEYTNSGKPDQNQERAQPQKKLDHQVRFSALKSFYKEQLLISDTNQSSSLDAAFSSPSSLSRLMNMYGSGSTSLKGKKQKSSVMREAMSPAEGLQLTADQLAPSSDPFHYDDTVSPEQQMFQYPAPTGNPTATHVSQLKPMPTRLRTKRSKRCATCKHILVKPELKVTSTRYRIRLTALNYIPYVTTKPVPVAGGLLPAGPDGDPSVILQPGKPSQWILTLRNPLFENVNVSLGSPSITPGKFGHKVTILCPQFSMGKNGEVWDDAALKMELTKSDTQISLGLGGEQVAGKVYDRGRNWTSIVIEVVPASIVKEKDEQLDEDEDVIETPIRVRLEWQITDEQALRNENTSRRGDGEDAEPDNGSRELSYWMVVGIGRVAS